MVINGLNLGGAERMLVKLLASDAFMADDIVVVSLTGEGQLSPVVQNLGYRLIHLRLNHPIFCFFDFLRLCFLVKSFRPDLIHTWLYLADLAGGLAGYLMRCKVVWSIRQSNLARSYNSLSARVCIQLCSLLSRTIPVTIISNSQAGVLSHAEKGYDIDRIQVIPNGINIKEFYADDHERCKIRESMGISMSQPVVGMVARFDEQKNHDAFFRAGQIIKGHFPDVRFVLCGEGVDPCNAELSALLRDLGLVTCSHLLGPRLDVMSIMNSMDVLVSTSVGEGWPNVVGEAMACQKLCVGTDVGDTRAIIGDAGFLAHSTNFEEVAAKVVYALNLSPERQKQISVRALNRISVEFDIEIIANRFRVAYINALANDGRLLQ